MLSEWKLDDKGWEEMWQEVQDELLQNGSEWSSFQDSDPGITILQGLVSLIHQQREEIQRKSCDIHPQLLKLTGFEREKMQPAETVAAIYCGESTELPAGQRFYTEDRRLVFENALPQHISSSDLTSVLAYDSQGTEQDISYVIWNRRKESYAYPFFQEPQEGSRLFFYFSKPLEKNEEISLYFDIYNKNPRRNPLSAGSKPVLGKLYWEVWEMDGFKPLAVKDETCNMLVSGILSFCLSQEMAEHEGRGYCIRATVLDSGFDIPPRLSRIFMNGVRLRQQKTIIWQHRADFDGESPVRVSQANPELFKPMVLGAEERGRLYQYEIVPPGSDPVEKKRFCQLTAAREGFTIDFSCGEKAYRPARGQNTVVVVCFDQAYVNQINAEGILGYDDQKINLGITGILPGSLSFLIGEKDEEDQPYFVCSQDETVTFLGDVDEKRGMVTVRRSRFFDDNPLIPSQCCISLGTAGRIKLGQIRECHDSRFQVRGNSDATGGRDGETEQECIMRLSDTLSGTVAAVTKEDYERLTGETPGLCIERVEAEVEGGRIQIVVKPAGIGRYPAFASGYYQAVRDHLEQYRMVTTEIRIQEAVYAPVSVRLIARCRNGDALAELEIRDRLEQELDSLNKPRGFGVTIRREKLVTALERLQCVQRIEALSLESTNENSKVNRDGDVLVRSNAVSCCGAVELVFR